MFTQDKFSTPMTSYVTVLPVTSQFYQWRRHSLCINYRDDSCRFHRLSPYIEYTDTSGTIIIIIIIILIFCTLGSIDPEG